MSTNKFQPGCNCCGSTDCCGITSAVPELLLTPGSGNGAYRDEFGALGPPITLTYDATGGGWVGCGLAWASATPAPATACGPPVAYSGSGCYHELHIRLRCTGGTGFGGFLLDVWSPHCEELDAFETGVIVSLICAEECGASPWPTPPDPIEDLSGINYVQTDGPPTSSPLISTCSPLSLKFATGTSLRWTVTIPAAPLMAEGSPPETERAFPPLARQVGNVAASLARHVAAGMPETPPKVLSARLSVCKGCEMLKEDRCMACGCSVRVKAAWNLERCPLNKWPA